jgi:hypothetical protein
VGAPIWDTYCPNEECDYERKRMVAGVRAVMERREREEYERLKAKFEPASGMEARSGETGTGSTEGDSPTAAPSGGDAQ